MQAKERDNAWQWSRGSADSADPEGSLPPATGQDQTYALQILESQRLTARLTCAARLENRSGWQQGEAVAKLARLWVLNWERLRGTL